MYDFFEEIVNLSGLPLDIFNKGFRVVNLSNRTVFIEGFVNIVSFESTEIIIKLKRGIVKVQGENLKIKNMNLETILIVGSITNLEIS
ncbi:MAG: YabP/YqfC family sporulation protein [Clostridia bacterium]|nr:YabP/YqfC family sporulation protein [Clostridia bacterium]